MLGDKDNQTLQKAFSFAAVFIDPNTEYKKTAALRRVHTDYSKAVADLREDIRQREWMEKNLDSLEKHSRSKR